MISDRDVHCNDITNYVPRGVKVTSVEANADAGLVLNAVDDELEMLEGVAEDGAATSLRNKGIIKRFGMSSSHKYFEFVHKDIFKIGCMVLCMCESTTEKQYVHNSPSIMSNTKFQIFAITYIAFLLRFGRPEFQPKEYGHLKTIWNAIATHIICSKIAS